MIGLETGSTEEFALPPAQPEWTEMGGMDPALCVLEFDQFGDSVGAVSLDIGGAAKLYRDDAACKGSEPVNGTLDRLFDQDSLVVLADRRKGGAKRMHVTNPDMHLAALLAISRFYADTIR